jgi:hypothetical protein
MVGLGEGDGVCADAVDGLRPLRAAAVATTSAKPINQRDIEWILSDGWESNGLEAYAPSTERYT